MFRHKNKGTYTPWPAMPRLTSLDKNMLPKPIGPSWNPTNPGRIEQPVAVMASETNNYNFVGERTYQ